MKSEAEKECERQIDRERKRMHMERVERHLDESRRQAEYNSPKQQQMREEQNELIIKSCLALLALMALFFFVLALISPGIIIAIHSLNQLGYQATTIEHWLYSTAISLAIFFAAYLPTRSIKIASAIYVASCLIASGYAYKSTFNEINTIDYVLNAFWPFGKANKTTDKSSATPSIGIEEEKPTNPRGTATQVETPKEVDHADAKTETVHHVETEWEAKKQTQGKNEFFENSAIKASFDCAKASRPIELMICSDPVLAELDSKLDATYKSALSRSSDQSSVKTAQISWIKNIARPCEDKTCLEIAYKQRISELESL